MKVRGLVVVFLFIHYLAGGCIPISYDSEEKKFFDKFSTQNKVGEGGFGSVFVDVPPFLVGPDKLSFRTPVAFKRVDTTTLSPKKRAELANEITANEILTKADADYNTPYGRTDSKYVARYYGCYSYGLVYYLAMEPLDGMIVTFPGTKPPKFATTLEDINHFIRLTEIIAFMHVNGFAHCDLKGENFMYKGTITNIRGIDLGLSAQGSSFCDGGTPHFVPPEAKIDHRRDVDRWNKGYDIYELGVMFGEHFSTALYNAATENQRRYLQTYSQPNVDTVKKAVINSIEPRLNNKIRRTNDIIILTYLRDLILEMLSYHPYHRPNISKVLTTLHVLRRLGEKKIPVGSAASPPYITDDEYYYELEQYANYKLTQGEFESQVRNLWNGRRILV